jgi:hypothetical protein
VYPGVIVRGAAFLAVMAVAALARAGDEAARVVVLPFVTSDEELVIYGRPVADAVARALGAPARVATEVDPEADVAVELRASRARRKVRIEAVVRDAETGATLSRVEGKSAPLADLDVAAGDLARRLRAPLAAAAAERLERRDRERVERAPPTVAPPTDVDTRAAIVVYQPDGRAGRGTAAIRGAGTSVVVRALSELGYRSIVSSSAGIHPAEIAARSAASARARATLMLYVYGVEYLPAGVLTARGQLRLMAVGADGRVLLDRYLETDTVVGSRGDRHDALVRFVLAQALDMARRDLQRALR